MTKKISKVLSLVLALILSFSVVSIPASAADVAKVKNLKVVETDEDEIEIKWSKVSSASGYQVYLKNGNGSWKRVKTTKSSSYEIEKLKSSETYSIKVRAYKTVNGKKSYGSFSSVVVTSTEPDEVKNLSISKKSNGKATLIWSAVKGAEGYRIYKYNSSSKSWKRIAELSKTSKTVSVSSKGGEKFRVRAFALVNGKYYFGDYSAVAVNGLDVIGYSKAKSIALKDASVKSSAVSEYEAELDKERGIYVYEIDFEAGKYEYEYKINAKTGKIIFKEKERR